MNRKSWLVLIILLSLGAVYLVRFTDLLHPPHIQINVAIRPFAPNPQPGDLLPMVFGIDEDWRLNMLRVVRPDPAGGAPKVMWNLTSDKGSQPMRGFVYGQEVPGMRLVGGAPPQPLEAGVTYHLEVRAGRARGATDFTPRSAESAQN